MRRVIALVALVGCAACAPKAGSPLSFAPEAAPLANHALFLPAAGEIPRQSAPTPGPQQTPSPLPVATADGWELTVLTRGGCCPGAFWSADSQEVRFLARPEPTQPASIYGVSRTGGSAKLVRRDPAFFSPDGAYTMTISGEDVVIDRAADQSRWTIMTGGRGVVFSHAMRSVAWTESSDAYANLNLIQRTIWVVDLDSGQRSKIVTVVGGGFLGWTSDDSAILVSGGLVTGGLRGVWRVGVSDGTPEMLFAANEVQGALVSPRGGWLAFFVAFESQPDRNGLWILRTRDGAAHRLDLFGSYRWRMEGRLLIIPLELNEGGDGLWQYDSAEGSLVKLFDPGAVPFKVANNDWSVSPDGAYIAFRSAADLNIWTLALPRQ